MELRKVRVSGGSLIISIPHGYLEALEIYPNDWVSVQLKDKSIVIHKVVIDRYKGELKEVV